MKKRRAPDLTPDIISQVLQLLDGWKNRLSWDLLLKALEQQTGVLYSRFTLYAYSDVARAFKARKEALSNVSPTQPSTPRDERVRAALEQAERAVAKAARLKAENDQLIEQFVTWAINAERKGVTMDMLNAPLPKPNRDRSKGVE